jgi:hypothetical protein
MRRARQDRAFGKKALWVCVISLSSIPAFAAAQQNGADQIRRTYGTTPAYEADTYRFAARDENGVRLTVNGRPIDLSGAPILLVAQGPCFPVPLVPAGCLCRLWSTTPPSPTISRSIMCVTQR